MFTGLVQQLAGVVELISAAPGMRLVIGVRSDVNETKDPITDASLPGAALLAGAAVGDSIAINGCCLTVVGVEDGRVSFDAGPETLQRTNLGELVPGSLVNLETSLSLGDSLGGHLVTGHIDGVGTVQRRIDDADWSTLWFAAPEPLMRQMASKGSVAIDGVSLTLVDVETDQFSVALIPHTLKVTTLGTRSPGDRVNLETDVLAKYVERQLQWKQ
jgi:riboflavin synthase